MITGTPGGPKIITMVYHVISNVIDHRMSLPDAVAVGAEPFLIVGAMAGG